MKVIGSGRLVPSAAEVDVPSWDDFNGARNEFSAAIERLQQQVRRVNEIKNIKRAVDQLTQSPIQCAATTYDREIRKIYEDIRELERNVWREGKGRTTLWQSVGRLEERLKKLPDDLRGIVRESVRAELERLFKSVKTNLDGVLKDNGELKNKVDRCHERVESAEKQFLAVPDKIAELQRLLDDAKANLSSAKDENNHLKEEVDTLRKELATCRKDVDALLHPPKREWFSGIRTRCSGFFRKIFSRGK